MSRFDLIQEVKPIADQMWICVKCRLEYKSERPHLNCPKCGANEDMQGPLPETFQFEMIEEWKSEEH